jgi:hypothetical protein
MRVLNRVLQEEVLYMHNIAQTHFGISIAPEAAVASNL